MATTYKRLGSVVAGSTRTSLFISNKVLTTNVATLTTSAVHGFAVGDVVEVAGVDATLDGLRVVSAVPTTTTFNFALTTANITTVAVSPTAIATRNHNLGGVVASNKLAVNGLVTITTATAHGLVAKDWIYVQVGDVLIDGLRQVYAAPSSTLVCFRVTGTSITTAACGGAVGKASSTWATLFGPVAASTADVMSTIAICNGHDFAANVRVALATSTSPLMADRIVQDSSVAVGDTIFLTIGLAADTGKYVMVQSNQPDVTFSVSAAEVV